MITNLVIKLTVHAALITVGHPFQSRPGRDGQPEKECMLGHEGIMHLLKFPLRNRYSRQPAESSQQDQRVTSYYLPPKYLIVFK